MKKRTLKAVRRRKLIILISILILLIIAVLIVVLTRVKENPLAGLETTNYEGSTVVETEDIDEVLLNPGKGLVLSNDIDESMDDITSVNYYTFEWSTIEPTKGEYDWTVIDEKIASCEESGKKFAFGIVNANTSSSTIYVTPRWVFEEGAEYYTATNKYGDTQVIPVWTDSIFLEELNNFIEALAARYDGNATIAYIDIRSYGNYGEQNLTDLGGDELTAEQLQELYITPYKEAFEETMLVNPWGETSYDDIYYQSIDEGITIRKDDIILSYDGQSCFEYAYGKLPTILECSNAYDELVEEGSWSEETLLDYIEQWKPSYIEISQEMYESNPEFYNMLANKVGYYFKLEGASFSSSVYENGTNDINLKFVNEGVAPLYEDCTVYIALLDENYNLIEKYKTDINPQTWMPDEEVIETASVTFENIEIGDYILAVGLFQNEDDESPTYLLGNSGGTDNNWYVIGQMSITDKQEECNITLENEDYFVNNNNEYIANVTVDKLISDYAYTIEKYVNDNLEEEIEITDLENTYTNSFVFDLPEGVDTIKIVIKRDDEEIARLEKEIYSYSAQESLADISSMAIEKYEEFEENFSNEIANIADLSTQINSLKQYMELLASKSSEDIDTAKEQMALHYELGNMILDSYDLLNVDYGTLNSMLDSLDDIGDLYEDLITLSATTVETTYTLADNLISSTEKIMEVNSDLNMIYPSQILNSAQELDEQSEHIYGVSEEADIKTGLIVSKGLHAYYLANWANSFAEIYRNDYIEDNPLQITYSTTDWTNDSVTVTLDVGSDSTVTNNDGSNTYVFEENGTFTFEYTRRDLTLTIEATVSNIDKESPTITGVEDGGVYTTSKKFEVEDDNLSSVSVSLDGTQLEYTTGGMTVKDKGTYNITAVDKAGNTTSLQFSIVESASGGYIIEDNYILNVSQKTTAQEFKNNFNASNNVKRNGTTVSDSAIVATGDTIETTEGTYTIIVAGDINGDGKVSAYDYSMLRNYLLKERSFNKIQLLAADINVDLKDVGVKDYSKMRNVILGGE